MMKIKVIENNGNVEMRCKGTNENMEEVMEFKKELKKQVMLHNDKHITISFYGCLTLPSSIIGAILELKEIENINIVVTVEKKELYETLRRLALIEILDVHHVKK